MVTEAEVVEQLVEFTSILLAGVGLIFSIVSAYVVALNYFIGSANLMARVASFGFITLVLWMLTVVLMGAQATHAGLVARLHELDQHNQLTTAGRALLGNSAPEWIGMITGHHYSVDDVVSLAVWAGLCFVYLGLAYLTFLHKWVPDVFNVALEKQK
ncbi:MAG: hypothetical protein ABUS57_06965 [Pseudomonadota bacterium]